MSQRIRFLSFALVVTGLSVFGPAALTVSGQDRDGGSLIEAALDESTRITLSDIRLGDAIQLIWDQTGVRIVMPAEVLNLAPYGAETVIDHVDIANIPLRDGLNRLFQPLGMTFEVRDRFVEIVPKDTLRCLGRRPTWDELETLGELAVMQPGVDSNALAQLRGRVQFNITARNGWDLLADTLRNVGAGPADEVLNVACTNLGWAWCVAGKRIVISSEAGMLRQRLQRHISLRMNYKALIDVVQAVGREAGVPIKIEPGALASLPLNVRKSSILNVHNKPAEEVLDVIAANTGLGYLIEPEGVLFYDISDSQPLSDVREAREPLIKRSRDPYVGKIITELEDGKTVEWLVRESELPPDLRDRRREDLQAAFEALRRKPPNPHP